MTNLANKSTNYHEPTLFIVGECLVDVVVDALGKHHRLFGGSPANIAVNTHQLGLKPLICATIGYDDHGAYLLDTLKARGLITDFIQRSHLRTSKVVVNQTSGSPLPTFYRGCDYEIHLTEAMLEAVKSADVLHFSYWPLTKEPAKKTLMQLIDVAKAHGTKIAFDPNVHPDLSTHESITREALLALLK